MSKSKPDKELNRLKHELEKVREQHDAAKNQLQLKDQQLDAAETRDSKIKAQTFENENEALRKELATTKDAVRSLKAEDKKEEDARAHALRQKCQSYQEKIRSLEEGQAKMRQQLVINQKAADKHRTEKEEAEMRLFRSQAQVGTQKASIIGLQEGRERDKEQHKKEMAASSQEFKILKGHFTETAKSYEKISTLYDDLVKLDGEMAESGALERGPQTTNWTYEQLLQKHNDLRREYTAKDQQCKDITSRYNEELGEAEQDELALEDTIEDLTQQLKTANLEAAKSSLAYETLTQQLATANVETKNLSEAYEAVKTELDKVKTELDNLKASNAESAARYQEWRKEMLRVVNEAPTSA